MNASLVFYLYLGDALEASMPGFCCCFFSQEFNLYVEKDHEGDKNSVLYLLL